MQIGEALVAVAGVVTALLNVTAALVRLVEVERGRPTRGYRGRHVR